MDLLRGVDEGIGGGLACGGDLVVGMKRGEEGDGYE